MKSLEVRRSSRLLILDARDRLLLFRYHDEHQDPFWSTVGGELKFGEGYREAAERELREETGFAAVVGSMVHERDAEYAVARTQPARWLERYFLVRYSAEEDPDPAGWTDEERSTIGAWKWWSASEMMASVEVFLPDYLPRLLQSVLEEHALNSAQE